MQNPRPSPKSSTTLRQHHGAEADLTENRAAGAPDDDRSFDPEHMTLEDITEAEASRPDLPGETADGLDEMEEEIRRQAEDLPSGTAGRE